MHAFSNEAAVHRSQVHDNFPVLPGWSLFQSRGQLGSLSRYLFHPHCSLMNKPLINWLPVVAGRWFRCDASIRDSFRVSARGKCSSHPAVGQLFVEQYCDEHCLEIWNGVCSMDGRISYASRQTEWKQFRVCDTIGENRSWDRLRVQMILNFVFFF